MSIEFEINGAQVKHGQQNRVLQFGFSIKSWYGGPAYLAGLEGQLSYNNFILCNHLSFQSYQFRNGGLFYLDKETSFQASLEAELSQEAFRYIEETRKENDPIQFTFKLIYRWQKVLNTNNLQDQNIRDGNVVVGPTLWSETTPYYNIARSSWIQLLKQLRYSEIELFEIQKPPLIEKAIWDESVRFLKDAENVFRHGDFEGTLSKCRQSLESLSKHFSPEDLKEGYKNLLENVFDEDEKKRKPINELILNLSEFAHLGRHANNPPVKISREDAEFVLVSTLNLLSFFSQRLSKNSKAN